MTAKEASAKFGLSAGYLYNLRQRGIISRGKRKNKGNYMEFDEAEIQKAIDDGIIGGNKPRKYMLIPKGDKAEVHRIFTGMKEVAAFLGATLGNCYEASSQGYAAKGYYIDLVY